MLFLRYRVVRRRVFIAMAGVVLYGCWGCPGEEEKRPTIDLWVEINGSVSDSVTSKPLPQVAVLYGGEGGKLYPVAESGSNGSYQVILLGTVLRGVLGFDIPTHYSREYSLVTFAEETGKRQYRLDAVLPRREGQ